MIKEVNKDSKPIVIKTQNKNEKGAIVIGEDDWNSIQETLYLVNNGVDKVVKNRENDGEEDFDKIWKEL